MSRLQRLRQAYQPKLPSALRYFHPGQAFRIGVVLSGGQAAGGHNVIAGIFDANPGGHLIGFLGGPSGIVEGKSIEITKDKLDPYRNQGGFDLIGSGRTKIETPEQFANALRVVKDLKLDGLVVIGGDDSNTNAALLAEYFLAHGCHTKVVGVPKTIDGDLQNPYVPISFGFDTACKVYSELIGNIARDALSAKKYYHFIKLMGRSASHIALECALKTHPNLVLISEEVAAKKQTLADITSQIADLICKRAESGKNYGIILLPEGLVEFIPKLLESMPEFSSHLDPHGNVHVSGIETEQLLITTVKEELKRRGQGEKFSPVAHFFGYEGRAAYPSNFDATYCYSLGFVSVLLVNQGLTGHMTSVRNLCAPVEEWEIGSVPLSQLMTEEIRKGVKKRVIKKALVDLEGNSYKELCKSREAWVLTDDYQYPGPIQFFGDPELTDSRPLIICSMSTHTSKT